VGAFAKEIFLSQYASIAPAQSASIRRGGLARLWRGEIKLATAFWLYGVVGAVIFRVAIFALPHFIEADFAGLGGPRATAIIFVFVLIEILYGGFVLVAIWRSAKAYAIAKPHAHLFATLAQIADILGGVCVVLSVVELLIGGTASNSSANWTDDPQLVRTIIVGLNADLPKKLDEASTLKKIDMQGLTLVYSIDLSTVIDDRSAFFARTQSDLRETCSDPDVLLMIQSGYVFRYVYEDSSPAPNAVVVELRARDCLAAQHPASSRRSQSSASR
jgi:hypothetical protein